MAMMMNNNILLKSDKKIGAMFMSIANIIGEYYQEDESQEQITKKP
jgi:hypothetical protein